MSTSVDVAVPSKIVIAGTSNMSLHQRFSKLPPTRPASQKVTVRSNSIGMRKPKLVPAYPSAMQAQMEYMEVGEPEEYDPVMAQLGRTSLPTIRRQRMPVYRPMPVPIDERISFPPQPRMMYVPVPRMAQQQQFRLGGGIRRGGANRFGGNNNYGYRYQNGTSNNNGVRQQFNRFGGPTNRGARGGFIQRGGFKKQQPKKTQEQLDKELDEYMKKPSNKHTPITI